MDNRLEHVMQFIAKQPLKTGKPMRIYLIKCGIFYKIGIALNPVARVAMLQTGNPRRIKLVKHWPSINAHEEERRIHFRLRQWRVRGEWFKLPPGVVEKL